MATPLVLVYNIPSGFTLELPINTGTITWGDGNTDTSNSHTYASSGIYTVEISGSGITTFDYNIGTGQVYLTECISFGTIGLTNASGMFSTCTNLTAVPATLPTSSIITNMFNMFYGATSFNQNISGWNTSSVTNMSGMFQNATSFNQNIDGWNTGSVQNISYMFAGATAFNQNIGSWNTSSVTTMSGIFEGATSFNQNIGGWTTTSVQDMSYMFNGATVFNQNIGGLNVENVVDMTDMLNGTAISTTNYDALLNGWVEQSLQTNVPFGAQGLTYTAEGEFPRFMLTNDYTWTITDSGLVCFREGTKILTDKGYIVIENLKKGDLVKTLKHGYKPIDAIAKKEFYNPALKDDRIKDQLYKCSQEEYPEVFEDLFITGGHAILVDDFKDDNERNKVVEIYKKIYETDNKYRLLACVDERASVYEVKGDFTIYHFALENDDDYLNYGVYANGLLVESCSKFFLKNKSNMSTF